MNNNKIFLNVRINFVTRCLILNEDEVRNVEFLVGKIFEEFEITSNQCINFKFRNNLMAPIEVMELPDLILQMKNSGSFYIELVLDEPPLTTRAEAIRNFIESSGHSNIFDELKVLGGKLSKKTEKVLFDCLFSYIIKTFTNEVAHKDIAESCKATLLLFPYMETTPSDIGGIDELYNSKAKKGIIFHKLRNSRAAAKKSVDLPDNEDTLSGKDLKTLLKYCVVKNDKQKLKEALRQTVSMRRKLLAEDDPELMEFWKFYFVDIEMIRYDFHLLFENINDKSLEEKWDELHKKPVLEFDKSIDFDKIPTVDVHIWQFISVYHSLKPRGDFWKSLSSIIIFSKDPHAEPTSLLHNVNRNPYIIAISSADKQKNKFYIAVKGILISVPEECNIIHTLDLVYKIHKIFDIQPHCHIKRMMDFLEYFIYENLSAVNPGSISKQMHELGDGLLRMTLE